MFLEESSPNMADFLSGYFSDLPRCLGTVADDDWHTVFVHAASLNKRKKNLFRAPLPQVVQGGVHKVVFVQVGCSLADHHEKSRFSAMFPNCC